jgi:hypothetical protein
MDTDRAGQNMRLDEFTYAISVVKLLHPRTSSTFLLQGM